MHAPAVVSLLRFLADEGYTSTDLLQAGGDLFVNLLISVSNSPDVKAAAEAMMAKEIKA
jgi:hypothetical protein